VEAATLRVCALLAYDGTDYHGFQVQRGVPTIQGELEAALARFTQPRSRVVGAGRTDAGVHARAQVIAVDAAWRHSPDRLQTAWNAHLPAAIALRRLVEAPEGFHPRFSAQWRTYRYTVVEHVGPGLSRSPLTERYALTVKRRLDLTAMQQVAAQWVGEHDFATFGRPTQGESTVRRVTVARWDEELSSLPGLLPATGRRLVLTITANGFLTNMVRCLVGACLAVGEGVWSSDDVAAALAARDRRRTAPPVSPQGLVLEQVVYPEQFDLWPTVAVQAAG
jgi:tRNA pseudouridine38-40 synthase